MVQRTPHQENRDRGGSQDDHGRNASEVFERLRRQVRRAIQEIRQLRRENRDLRARMDVLLREKAELETDRARQDQTAEELRRQIDGFVQRIDRYLEDQP
ncbi:MAG: cell division protein ZapB [Rhodothermales bacterium]